MSNLYEYLNNMSLEKRLYILEALPTHLAGAKQLERLHAILSSFEFMEAKAKVLGPESLIDDYDLSDEGTLRLIQRALRREAHVLGEHPDLIWQQLYNRLQLEKPVPQMLAAELARRSLPGASPWLKQIGQAGAEEQLLLHELHHPDKVTGVAFSPDGRSVLTGCQDGLARLWDLKSGRVLRQFGDRTSAISCVAFSPNGRLIVTGSDDQTARIWDVTSGLTLHILRGHTDVLYNVAFSLDGKRVATTSRDETVRVWDSSSGASTACLPDHCAKSDIVFLPNGQEVVTCMLHGIMRLWNIESGHVVTEWEMQGGYCTGLSLSSDVAYLMVVAGEDNIYRWDIHRREGWTPILTFLERQRTFLPEFTFSPNGAYIAASDYKVAGTPIAWVWKLQTGELWCSYRLTDTKSSLAFSPDSTQIVVGDANTARIWELPPTSVTRAGEPVPESIRNMCISQDGRRLVTLSYQGQVQIWNIATGGLLKRLHIDAKSYFPEKVAISSNGKLVALVTPSRILLWDVAHNRRRMELVDPDPDPKRVNSLAFSPNGRVVAAGLATGAIRLWNLCTQQIIATLPEQLYPVMYPIRDLVFAPDGSWIFATFTDGTAKIWDAIHYTRLAVFPETVRYLCVSPDGKRVATWGDDRIELWSIHDGTRLSVVQEHIEV